MESSKKELKELREKVSQLQADLADREVEEKHTHTHTHVLICAIIQDKNTQILCVFSPSR